jgi:hypothetical protein
MVKIKRDTKRALDRDQKLQKVNTFLETQRSHKKWFKEGGMGKQRGKPRLDMGGIKKKKK